MRAWRDRLTRPAGEEGFTLLETVVALGIAATALLGLLGSSIFALQATVGARQNQQAGDYLNKAIEQTRSLPYAGIANVTSDLAGDPKLTVSGGIYSYNPGTGAEVVDGRSAGAIVPHLTTGVTTNGRYTVRRYVTVPAGTPVNAQGIPAVRRLTVEVSWTQAGRERTRRSSTILTDTRRGLPLPNYTWLYNGPAAVISGKPTQVKNPGNDVSYGFALTNLGARDSWLVTMSTSGWTLYVDTDRDGIWSEDASEPPLAANTTPLIEPGQALPFYLVAHRVIGAAESGTASTTFSATSVSQPTVAAKTVSTTLTVTNGTVTPPTASPTATPSSSASPVSCNPGTNAGSSADMVASSTTTKPSNSYTTTRLTLLNGPEIGDSPTKALNTMTPDTGGLQSQLCNFSTDQSTNTAGRVVVGGGAAGFGQAVWAFQPTANKGAQIGGNAAVVMLVQCTTGGTPTVTAKLTRASAPSTVLGTGTVTMPTNCNAGGFIRQDITIPISGTPIFAKTDQLVLTVTASATVRLAYGTTALNSRLTIAIK